MKLQEIKHNGFRWINITDPDQEMVEYLRQNFEFHHLDLEDLLSKVQYPKIDSYENYLFVILQFPVYESERRIYKRSELDMFVSKDFLITINTGDLQSLQNFFEACAASEDTRGKFMGRGVGMLLYEIIDAMMDYVFPIINQKNDIIFQLEEEIYEKTELKDMVQEIMILKRNIINIKRILQPQRKIFVDLQLKHRDFIPETMVIYFDDVIDKKDKIISQLETAIAYVEVLEQANESTITRNTNKIITLLTIFTVMMLPLTLITSYYGMNVQLPLQDDPHAVTYINVFMFFLLILMTGFFVKKKLL